MAKFQVLVIESREFRLAVDAANERGALEVAEELVRAAREVAVVDAVAPFDVEAVEAVLLSDSEHADTGGASLPGSAPRHEPVSSPSGHGGARTHLGPTQIARRFGLGAAAIALMGLAAPPPAHATGAGGALRVQFIGATFDAFSGTQSLVCTNPSWHCSDAGAIVLNVGGGGLATYAVSGYGADAFEVTSTNDPAAQFYYNAGPNTSPVNPGFYQLIGYYDPSTGLMDTSQGWSLQVDWDLDVASSSYLYNAFSYNQFLGPFITPGAEEEGAYVRIAGTGEIAAEGQIDGVLATVTDPYVAAEAPEPSTWAMVILGFAGLSLLGIARRRTGVRPNALSRRGGARVSPMISRGL